ncbi:HAMP domain-containing sensor histidine kinase [Lutibacter sp.]|uniref:ATP-binding protein n=1 Tax=Lutibacter sp. TaxID=1925666 RepID=UPI0025C3C767|nr:HAMP domain-containing sensor histidine kinase [Lutibacter sp.]MCF6182426.1 HAMP domain-containing histidine kinase [Lutibacter sp.]
MSNKLLHKTLQVYLVYSVIIFIIVAPLFYFLADKFYINNIDETLLNTKIEFVKITLPKLKNTDIPLWNKFNKNIKIKEYNEINSDTLFYTSYYDIEEQEKEPYRELNSTIIIDGKRYTFSFKINLIESEDLMLSIALLFFGLIIFMLLGLFFITKKLSIRLWKPFYQTLNQIEQFEIDKNMKPQFSTTSIEEFKRLNKSIENLIKKNSIIYENQREFVENAAHELQTPIAIFKGKLELLMQRSDITKGQADLLEDLNKSTNRLTKLNKNLLLLSKIDKNQFDEISSFQIKGLIEKQLDFFKEQATLKNITIEINLKDAVPVNTNITLTEVLVSNLFLNAIRHNILNGKIMLQLVGHKLVISNTGSPIAINSKSLFNRFSKSNSSKKGNGLGLAIVKKIADLNNWEITYSYSNSLHTFSVIF